VKTEKLGGVAGGEGECGDDVAGWLVRERERVECQQSHLVFKNTIFAVSLGFLEHVWGW